jgi:hypothetical protein
MRRMHKLLAVGLDGRIEQNNVADTCSRKVRLPVLQQIARDSISRRCSD